MRTLFALLLGSSLLTAPAMAQSAWTGGDDLPTSPLACDATVTAVPPGEYNGGTPTGAPDRKGKPLTVVDIPKLVGVGYFNSTAQGIQEAAKETGSMTVTTDGPTKANIDSTLR